MSGRTYPCCDCCMVKGGQHTLPCPICHPSPVQRARLAAAWDEGRQVGKSDAARNAVRVHAAFIETPNPYRSALAVTPCASSHCLKPCDRMLDPEADR